MSFGLQFTNTSGTVTLDTEYARLNVLCTGTYTPNSDSGIAAKVTFPVTITSQEPPLVFIRPTTIAALSGHSFTYIIGSPGAWTGFYTRGYNNVTQPPSGKYFAAAFMAAPTASFGLRLWDGSSKLLFDSGTASAVFSRVVQNWTFVKSEQTGAGSYRNWYSVPHTFLEDEYMMLNNFGMNMVAGSSVGRLLFSIWDFPNKVLYAVTVAGSNPTAFYLPAMFAKLTV